MKRFKAWIARVVFGRRPTVGECQVVIEAGIEATERVINCWQRGDLAGAVNQLEDWAVQAADYLDDGE